MEMVGLEIGLNISRIALLTKKGHSVSICSLQEMSNVKLLDLGLSKKRMVTGLEISDLLLKQTLVKLKKIRDIKKALPFQMQTLTSLPHKEVLFSPQLLRQTQEGFHLLFFITTKQHVKDHLKKLSKFSFDPDLVSAIPMALARFAKFLFPKEPSLFLLHFEQDGILCLLIENHLPSKMLSLDLEENFPKEQRTSVKEEGKINLLEADAALKQRIEHAFASLFKGPLPLLLSGEKELFWGSEHLWHSSFSQFVSYLLSSPEKEGRFAIPIGLALDAFSPTPLSFRQQELMPSKHLVLLGRKIFFLFFSLLFLFSSLSVGAEFFFKKRKELLEKKWQELCVSEGMEKKTLSALEKALKKESKDFPYYLQAPQVTHILSWLKTHPIFGKEEEGKPLFELLNFHYELLEMPTLQDPQKPNLIRVEIEFAVPSAFWARKFHESLIEEETILEKKEVEWESVSENRYKVSFYLKPISLKELYDPKNL